MNYDELLEKIEEARTLNKKIGLVQGSWDLFHLGHLLYIKEARKLCDFLIIAMDSDEKIKKRKGNNRPIIPEDERYGLLSNLDIADYVIIKQVDEKKWGLIKAVKPDVLVVIKENYTDEQIIKLKEYCKEIKVLPRQSESSTSDKIRKITISDQKNRIEKLDEKVLKSVEEFKSRINYNENMPREIIELIDYMKYSSDWECPVAASIYHDGRWYFGVNSSDFNIPKYDVENRTELYYVTCEHAEINLLKKLGDLTELTSPLYTTLFPCDKCMKVLINKGIKKIYYLEDHEKRNWSKRSHELAEKHGVETINLLEVSKKNEVEQNYDFSNFRYVYPPNARDQKQLDIMIENETNGLDPFSPESIEQEILFKTKYWYVSQNRFPYDGVKEHFLIIALGPVYRIEDINNEMWKELHEIWVKISSDYKVDGGAMCFRFGSPALSGATLTRLHAHVIMPEEDKKARFGIGGRKVLRRELRINKEN